jgi:hypothetical protein
MKLLQQPPEKQNRMSLRIFQRKDSWTFINKLSAMVEGLPMDTNSSFLPGS